MEEGEWFGIENVILESPTEYDAVIVGVPLRKILNDYNSDKLLRKIMRDMAVSVRIREIKAATKISCGNEEFFFKYLKENDFILKYGSLKEISEILNIKLRTLQRTLKNLTEK